MTQVFKDAKKWVFEFFDGFFDESSMILKQKIEGIYTDIQGYNDEVASQIMKRKKAEIWP